jgi:hypothetical protein
MYYNKDALCVLTILIAFKLITIHNTKKNIIRLYNKRHLKELASEFCKGYSYKPIYRRFIADCEKFLFALEAVDIITRASFIYL